MCAWESQTNDLPRLGAATNLKRPSHQILRWKHLLALIAASEEFHVCLHAAELLRDHSTHVQLHAHQLGELLTNKWQSSSYYLYLHTDSAPRSAALAWHWLSLPQTMIHLDVLHAGCAPAIASVDVEVVPSVDLETAQAAAAAASAHVTENECNIEMAFGAAEDTGHANSVVVAVVVVLCHAMMNSASVTAAQNNGVAAADAASSAEFAVLLIVFAQETR